jgi:23S rRNA (cytidine1920-2'-O)/16S rRNA (cytidine1409-2'-O)-methyltransferase
VRLLEQTNVRTLDADAIGGAVALVVADLSFVSLRTDAPALVACAAPHGRFLLLVKPQFELPRARVPRGGVVRDPRAWADAMELVADVYRAQGCALTGAAPSMLPGPRGNREFFVLLDRAGGTMLERAGQDAGDDVILRAVESAP